MSFLSDAATFILLLATVVAAAFAFWYYSRQAQLAAQVQRLEEDLEGARDARAKLADQLVQREREVGRLNAALPASAKLPELELIKNEPSKGKPAQQKKEKPTKDLQRIKELEAQNEDFRKTLDRTQRNLEVREQDLRSVRAELEELQVAMRDMAQAAEVARAQAQQAPVVVQAPVIREEVIERRPELPDREELEALQREGKELFEQALKIKNEAAGRANMAEFEAKKANDRVVRLDKRAHELLDRLLVVEREARKYQRQADAYLRMYLGLRGRFEVARDTLIAFQDRFKVELPTADGVELFAPLEDVVELEDEERAPRPRAERSRGPRGRRAEGAADEAAEGNEDSAAPEEAEEMPTPAETAPENAPAPTA